MHPNLQFFIEELDCAILEDWHRVTFRHDTRIEIEALAIKNCGEGGSEYSGVLIFKNSICDVTFLRNVNGHFKPKSDENRTTAKLVKSSRTGTIEETKPLIVTITHDKTANQRKQVERSLQWGRYKEQYPPVPRIGSNNDVVTVKKRKRRLGPPETVYGEGL